MKAAVLATALALFTCVGPALADSAEEIAFSRFLDQLEARQIAEVEINGQRIEGRDIDGGAFETHAPVISSDLIEQLLEQGVKVHATPVEEEGFWELVLSSLLPILLLVGVFFFVLRRLQGGGNPAMGFGKSQAKLVEEGDSNVTFADVAGIEEAKFELQEIVGFLRDPRRFTRLGGRIPKGVILVGPPGTGKTLLARAVAGEAEVPFFSLSGSNFVELFVGVGASRVRDLFQKAREASPCILFIDEIDAVGRHRGMGMGGGHDEREQTLNQLLVEMDGFEANEAVIIMAATNRADVLDPALMRPGRFDRQVVVPPPDLSGRLAILKVHSRRISLGDDIDLELLARATIGMVGADLENLVNEAALGAALREAERVDQQDFERARDKVTLGAERKSFVISDEDKRITAYHEAGHALIALLTPEESDPVHKVTIVPRGPALGVTQSLPTEDRYCVTRSRLIARLRHILGGRAAEELVFGHWSSGAANDLAQATRAARSMICRFGMNEKIGPVYYDDNQSSVFLGRDFMSRRSCSDKKAAEIEQEISGMLGGLYDEALQKLREHRATLDRIAEALLERETLNRDDLAMLLAE